MPAILQHLLALGVVAACVAYVLFQVVRTLQGKRSSAGNCCATGCQAKPSTSRDATTKTGPAAERIAFIPVERLTRRRR